MGPYCKFCDQRCFVPNPRESRITIIATCPEGQAHDKAKLGYNYAEVLPEIKIRAEASA
jgi:hypothetical protein